ncbi:hypothetical protein HPQ61_11275 [Acetobacteraceae bacterium]|nr:hypothetical protein [Acetobacteraceae bacterium]
MRVRIRMSVQHRPFWLEVSAGQALATWGTYVLLMRIPIGHVRAFAALDHLQDANYWVGGIAAVAGLSQVAIVLLNVTLGRILCTAIGMLLWVFAYRVTGHQDAPRPGIVLYAEPVVQNAFAMVWLFYDLTRRRRYDLARRR